MVFTQPLELEHILVNIFSGSPEMFAAIAMIALAAMAAMFRMPSIITVIMFAFFGLFFANYLGGIWFIIVMLAGLAIYWTIARFVK